MFHTLHIDLLDSHNTMEGRYYLPLLYRRENRGTESLSSFLKIARNLTHEVSIIYMPITMEHGTQLELQLLLLHLYKMILNTITCLKLVLHCLINVFFKNRFMVR